MNTAMLHIHESHLCYFVECVYVTSVTHLTTSKMKQILNRVKHVYNYINRTNQLSLGNHHDELIVSCCGSLKPEKQI